MLTTYMMKKFRVYDGEVCTVDDGFADAVVFYQIYNGDVRDIGGEVRTVEEDGFADDVDVDNIYDDEVHGSEWRSLHS